MWGTSDFLLEKGKENPQGSYHLFMASIVFTAFTLEAYLNHIGVKLFQDKCYSAIERLGPRDKLAVIAERLNVSIIYGERPWQVIKSLYKFRNEIAHGKSKELKSDPQIVELDSYQYGFHDFILTDWEKYCSQENAEKARADVEKIIFILHRAGDFQMDAPFTHGSQIGSATVID